MNILIIFLVALLLVADFVIAFVIGCCTQGIRVVKMLREKGWKIEPPKEGETAV